MDKHILNQQERQQLRSKDINYPCIICKNDETKFDRLQDLKKHYMDEKIHLVTEKLMAGINMMLIYRHDQEMQMQIEEEQNWIRMMLNEQKNIKLKEMLAKWKPKNKRQLTYWFPLFK